MAEENTVEQIGQTIENARRLKILTNKMMAQPIFFPSRSMKVKNKRRAAHNERTKRK